MSPLQILGFQKVNEVPSHLEDDFGISMLFGLHFSAIIDHFVPLSCRKNQIELFAVDSQMNTNDFDKSVLVFWNQKYPNKKLDQINYPRVSKFICG